MNKIHRKIRKKDLCFYKYEAYKVLKNFIIVVFVKDFF